LLRKRKIFKARRSKRIFLGLRGWIGKCDCLGGWEREDGEEDYYSPLGG